MTVLFISSHYGYCSGSFICKFSDINLVNFIFCYLHWGDHGRRWTLLPPKGFLVLEVVTLEVASIQQWGVRTRALRITVDVSKLCMPSERDWGYVDQHSYVNLTLIPKVLTDDPLTSHECFGEHSIFKWCLYVDSRCHSPWALYFHRVFMEK